MEREREMKRMKERPLLRVVLHRITETASKYHGGNLKGEEHRENELIEKERKLQQQENDVGRLFIAFDVLL